MIPNETTLMRQLSTRDQVTQKLTTKGHCKAFSNEQNPYLVLKMLQSYSMCKVSLPVSFNIRDF